MEEGPQAALIGQLGSDDSGELRDQMIDELQGAAQDIEAALEDAPEPVQAGILRELLEVVRLSEGILQKTWESLRG
jgi:hypothetical protein